MTQTWLDESSGDFKSRRKTERNDEIARLYYVEGIQQRDLCFRYGIRPERISQIVNTPRYAEMRAAWARGDFE